MRPEVPFVCEKGRTFTFSQPLVARGMPYSGACARFGEDECRICPHAQESLDTMLGAGFSLGSRGQVDGIVPVRHRASAS